jgi:outer membrane immunogenic protein
MLLYHSSTQLNYFRLLAIAGLLIAVIARPSLGADLPQTTAPNPSTSFDWSGVYAGINGGYGYGSTGWSTDLFSTGNFPTRGYVVGGTLGYNFKTGVWVWGLEGDFDYSTMSGASCASLCAPLCFPTQFCETKNPWFATARARIGYAVERFLPFITGGTVFGKITMTPAVDTTDTATKVGFVIGGGLEYAFRSNWSAKVEYLYADLGQATCSTATCGIGTPVNVKFNTNLVRVGVNYHF